MVGANCPLCRHQFWIVLVRQRICLRRPERLAHSWSSRSRAGLLLCFSILRIRLRVGGHLAMEGPRVLPVWTCIIGVHGSYRVLPNGSEAQGEDNLWVFGTNAGHWHGMPNDLSITVLGNYPRFQPSCRISLRDHMCDHRPHLRGGRGRHLRFVSRAGTVFRQPRPEVKHFGQGKHEGMLPVS